LLVFRFKRKKVYDEKYAVLKKDFDEFESLWTDKVAKFKEEKRGLNGIYQDLVTGDKSAFS